MKQQDSANRATPLFSIITVCYNAARDLEPTMTSVANQSFGSYEHIIIDGASTDNTAEVVARLATAHTRFKSSADDGIYYAMNKGLAEAQGKYVLFLNAGDSLHSPDTLAGIADLIFKHNYPGVVFGQTDIVNSRRERLGSRHLTAPANLTYKSFANGMMVCHQSFVALRQLTGQYNTTYRYSADFGWCIRVLQHSKCNVLFPGVIADYLSEGTTTQHHRASLKERFEIMCHYYGTVPTVIRHIKFAIRAIKRRFNSKQPQ